MPGRMAQRALIAVMVIVTGASFGVLSASPISINGYYKNFSTAIKQPTIEDLSGYDNRPMVGAVTNRLRLHGGVRLSKKISLDAAYDLSPRVQDRSLFSNSALMIGLNPSTYRAADLDKRLYPRYSDDVASFAVFQNLDRLFLTIHAPWADVYVGRQAISWGSARVVNPTDVIVPFMFNDLDIEDRVGVDAVRARIPVGMLSEIDAGYAFGDKFRFAESAPFLRTKLYYWKTDITLIAVGFRRNLLTGFDFTRAIGGAGFWFESAYVFAGAFDKNLRDPGEDYLRASIGADYSLRDGTYLFVEYHFNQAGSCDPDRYLDRLQSVAYREGAVYLMGRHYLIPGVTYQFTPLIILTGETMVNLSGPSVFLLPKVDYNIAENIYLSGGIYLGVGQNPRFASDSATGPEIHLRSEFGAYPDMFFTSFRVYF
jgi:hypothetical protein